MDGSVGLNVKDTIAVLVFPHFSFVCVLHFNIIGSTFCRTCTRAHKKACMYIFFSGIKLSNNFKTWYFCLDFVHCPFQYSLAENLCFIFAIKKHGYWK